MADGAPIGLRAARGSRAPLLRCVRVGTLLLYAVLAAVGALLHPVSVLLLGPPSAVLGGAAVIGVRRGLAGDLPPLPHPLAAAVVGGGLPAALSTLGSLGPWGGLAVAGMLAGAAVLVENWITSGDPVS